MFVTADYVDQPFSTTSDAPGPLVVPSALGDATSDNISSGITVLAVLAFAALAFGIVNLGKKKKR